MLALVTAAKKLRHSFETHQIVVMTNYPIKNVLRKPEFSGRMSKWSVMLSSYDIQYQPRTAIQSQALADFVADFSPGLVAPADKEVKAINSFSKEAIWTLFVDGSSNQRGAGLGVMLKSPQGDKVVQSICCDFKATNNEAEYEALIAGMVVAKDLGATGLNVYSDSLLVVSQITGDFAAKDAKMTAYLEIAKHPSPLRLSAQLYRPFTIRQIPRGQTSRRISQPGISSKKFLLPISTPCSPTETIRQP